MKSVLQEPSKALTLAAILFGMPMLAFAVEDLMLNIGRDNKVDKEGAAAIGTANSVGKRSLAVGFNNHLEGANSAAVGEGLVIRQNNGFAVGSFNETEGRPSKAIFVIGMGDSEKRDNALEVYPDGTILIGKPQGDIPMYNPNKKK